MPSVCYLVPDEHVPSSVHAELGALRKMGFDVHTRPDEASHIHLHGGALARNNMPPIAKKAGQTWSLRLLADDLFPWDSALNTEQLARLANGGAILVVERAQEAQLLKRKGVHPRQIRVIPRAVDLSWIRNRPTPPTELGQLLAVGPWTPESGISTLVSAFEEASSWDEEIRLLLLGVNAVDGLPAGIECRVMPGLEEARRILSYVDLVIAPSTVGKAGKTPNFPLFLAEATALGRPIIASKYAGIDDLIADNVNGILVPPNDQDSLAAAMKRLIARPVELIRLATAGPTLAAAHDARVVAAQLVRGVFTG